MEKQVSPQQREELLKTLNARFKTNMHRHTDVVWDAVWARLEANPQKLWSLYEMERTGGEPDVISHDQQTDEYVFVDCSAETPKGRRSLCYDQQALEARKEHKPADSAMAMASAMGIDLLTEAEYRQLQTLDRFDTKTSSWLRTPADIRNLGGALFADFRYGHVFVYHNGADSYYGSRAFRGALRV